MTPEQTQLVQASFARLAPSVDTVAEMFYRELFALDPGLRKLFKSDLAQQGRKLMSLLGTAIVNLDRLESVAPQCAISVAATLATVSRPAIVRLSPGP